MTIVCAHCGSPAREAGRISRCFDCSRPEIRLGPEAGLAFDAFRGDFGGNWQDPNADFFELPQIDLPELVAILSAHRSASRPWVDALRVRVVPNAAFTRDGIGCDLCGFWYRWRETVAFFTKEDGSGPLCPSCVLCDVGEGTVVLVNEAELDRIISRRRDELARVAEAKTW